MTKDEYIAFLEQQNMQYYKENMQYYKEIQQLTYEKGYLQGRLFVFIQRYPRLGMDIEKGGKYYELKRKGGEQ